MRQIRHQPIAQNQLEHYRIEGGITPSDDSLTTECEIKKVQQLAYQHLKTLQTKHQELRESFLEGLAKALVLDRSPELDNDSLHHIKLDRKEKQLNQLISREKNATNVPENRQNFG
jgi:hypothetical protein